MEKILLKKIHQKENLTIKGSSIVVTNIRILGGRQVPLIPIGDGGIMYLLLRYSKKITFRIHRACNLVVLLLHSR